MLPIALVLSLVGLSVGYSIYALFKIDRRSRWDRRHLRVSLPYQRRKSSRRGGITHQFAWALRHHRLGTKPVDLTNPPKRKSGPKVTYY